MEKNTKCQSHLCMVCVSEGTFVVLYVRHGHLCLFKGYRLCRRPRHFHARMGASIVSGRWLSPFLGRELDQIRGASRRSENKRRMLGDLMYILYFERNC